jgi:hypothetical protein
MAFEEDPRIEEHNKLTDRLLALGDEECHLKLYEEYLRTQDCKIREESAKKQKEVASEEIID